jgi:hypothetical protein
MAVLQWNVSSLKFFEFGVSKPVLFAHDPATDVPGNGVAWEGLISVTEQPSGAEVTKLWANDVEYAQLISKEEFAGQLEAYTYPDALNTAMGIAVPDEPGLLIPQQNRYRFSMSYVTRLHSDGGGQDIGYLIHILYNLRLAPSERANTTVNETPEAMTFTWDFTSTAKDFNDSDHMPVSKIVVDSRTTAPATLTTIEDSLYGTELEESTLLSPDELVALFTTP